MKRHIRRQYSLPLDGPTGLDPIYEKMLAALHTSLSRSEMKDALPLIPGLATVKIVEALPDPLPDDELRKKYDLPPVGPLSLNPSRMNDLTQVDRKIRSIHAAEDGSYKKELEKTIRGILIEQRFICAWTHDGFKQPGVKLVRAATEDEDKNCKTDAVMEFENGKMCRFQIKSGIGGDFRSLAYDDVVLVYINLEDPPEKMRHEAISALMRFVELKKQMARITGTV